VKQRISCNAVYCRRRVARGLISELCIAYSRKFPPSTERSVAKKHLPRPRQDHPAHRRPLAEQYDEWAEGHRYLGLDVLARA